MSKRDYAYEAGTEVLENGAVQSRIAVRLDLFDAKTLLDEATVLEAALQKYPVDNWRKIGGRSHVNHALYHLYEFLRTLDREHLLHASLRAHMAAAVISDYAGEHNEPDAIVGTRSADAAAGDTVDHGSARGARVDRADTRRRVRTR